MAKTKTPFLSMGSSGTLGRAITSQKRGARTLLRTKPTPAQPYSLPQAYQRWLYQDYCAEWSALSDADKQTWKSAASRYHMPGMAYFLRNRLTALADIAGGWHLDHIAGNSVIDFSKNLNHGTVYGATLVDGIIDHGLSFDGVDDRILIPHSDSLNLIGNLTIEAIIRPNTTESGGVLDKKYNSGGYMLWWEGSRFYLYVNAVAQAYSAILPLGIWYRVTGIVDGIANQIYIDAQPGTSLASATPTGNTSPLYIGRDFFARYPNVSVDEVRISNRALLVSDLIRHLERRYP